jgi:hypothetical protein
MCETVGARAVSVWRLAMQHQPQGPGPHNERRGALPSSVVLQPHPAEATPPESSRGRQRLGHQASLLLPKRKRQGCGMALGAHLAP